jgi:LysM repeat protein
VLAVLAYYVFEQTVLREVDSAAEYLDVMSSQGAGTAPLVDFYGWGSENVAKGIITKTVGEIPGLNIALDVASSYQKGGIKGALLEITPGHVEYSIGSHLANTGNNILIGVSQSISTLTSGITASRGPNGSNAGSTPMWVGMGTSGATPNAANYAIASNVMQQPATTSAAPGATNGTAAGSGGSSAASSSSYVVKSGDTLGNIAYKNGTTATALGKANNIQNLNLIHPGQVITVPKR